MNGVYAAVTRVKLAVPPHPLTDHGIISFISSDLSQIHRELRVSIGFSMSMESPHPPPRPRKLHQLPNFRTTLCIAPSICDLRGIGPFCPRTCVQNGTAISDVDKRPRQTHSNYPIERDEGFQRNILLNVQRHKRRNSG